MESVPIFRELTGTARTGPAADVRTPPNRRLSIRISLVTARLLALLLFLLAATPSAQTPPAFEVHEATIAQIHAAMRAGRLTCRGLVEQYLRRIDAYDAITQRFSDL